MIQLRISVDQFFFVDSGQSMPYGTRTYGKASRVTRFLTGTKSRRGKAVSAARAATVKRKTNGAVARIQRKPYVPQRRKNTASIVTLARQVKSLQNAQLGLKQYKVDGLTISLVPTVTNSSDHFNAFYPMCFAANNITTFNSLGSSLFGLRNQATHPNSTAFAIKEFADQSFPSSTVFEKCDFWRDYRADAVSHIAYTLISMKITITVTVNMQSTNDDVWLRFDPISKRPKNTLLNTDVHNYSLPHCMGGMNYLAMDNAYSRQKINYAYWRKEGKTRYMVFKNITGVAQNMTKSITIDMPCDGKPFTPDLQYYTGTGTGQESWLSNVPPHRQQYVLINTNGYKAMTMSIARSYSWRDPVGSVPAEP